MLSIEKNPECCLDFKIKTYEIDVAGHVNNIVYIKWVEDLRCQLFESIFPISKLLSNNLFPVVLSTEISYRKQLKLTDRPTGKIIIDSIKHGLLFLKIEFYNQDYIVASASQKCALINLLSNKMDTKSMNNIIKKRSS